MRLEHRRGLLVSCRHQVDGRGHSASQNNPVGGPKAKCPPWWRQNTKERWHKQDKCWYGATVASRDLKKNLVCLNWDDQAMFDDTNSLVKPADVRTSSGRWLNALSGPLCETKKKSKGPKKGRKKN